MKIRISHRWLFIVGLSALLSSPAFAAFGDDTAPANALSGNGAPGSALPPGTYPSSPSDGDARKKNTTDVDKRPPHSEKHKKTSQPTDTDKAKPKQRSAQ